MTFHDQTHLWLVPESFGFPSGHLESRLVTSPAATEVIKYIQYKLRLNMQYVAGIAFIRSLGAFDDQMHLWRVAGLNQIYAYI